MPANSRRKLLLCIMLGVVVGAESKAQENLTATLKDTLEKGLKCRRTVEFQFINQVVALVESGQLPRDVVLGTFAWARGQRDDIPFPYFQAALRARAKKYGVSL